MSGHHLIETQHSKVVSSIHRKPVLSYLRYWNLSFLQRFIPLAYEHNSIVEHRSMQTDLRLPRQLLHAIHILRYRLIF